MTEGTLSSSSPAASILRRLGFLLPVAFFVVVAVGLGIGLTRNPQEIPSALIGKPVPEFALPPVQGRVNAAIEAMMAAAARHGVVSAIHMASVEPLQAWLRKGMGMAMYSSDLGFLLGDPSKGGVDRLRSGR
jgi:hypothetical protein